MSARVKSVGKSEGGPSVKSALQVNFTADAVTRVSRQTLKRLAQTLGVSETQTIHFALVRLKQELSQGDSTAAKAGRGDGDDYPPLAARQLEAIRRHQPRRKKRGLVDSLIR
jgi:hypothetical protein